MASAPQGLPLLYNDLTPISSQAHGDWKLRAIQGAHFLKNVHAVPLLAEEFISASRFYPIVFSLGADPVPLALMGLNEGVNTFVDERGMFPDDYYVPAYVRRYPFLLAKLTPDADELSLCIDPTAEAIGAGGEGEPLFDNGAPSERTRQILGFCEQMEQASGVTAAFFRDIAEQKLLIDGEFSAQPDGAPQPYIYRGFQIVSEEALKNLRGDVARKWVQSGLLPLIYAHLFSLQRMTDVFGRQIVQGKMPAPELPILS
ncbi:SapC family protein [uncultured Sphingomonas sp.]|uniref:SapC family protein n=1 Tax=uncultured Sphingomonas sp. TaxID=158754 RepID=UPI002607300C|nr:SapC family protein [uncultured Sphingomonas sp.]